MKIKFYVVEQCRRDGKPYKRRLWLAYAGEWSEDIKDARLFSSRHVATLCSVPDTRRVVGFELTEIVEGKG